MIRVFSQCRKELAQFRRDRISVGLAFLLPVITLFLFGFGTRLEVKDLPVAIINFDAGKASRDYVERIFATRQLIPSSFQGSEPYSPLDRGKARASLVIPPEFSRDLRRGESVNVQAVVDAIKDSLDLLPGTPRTQVGVLTCATHRAAVVGMLPVVATLVPVHAAHESITTQRGARSCLALLLREGTHPYRVVLRRGR